MAPPQSQNRRGDDGGGQAPQRRNDESWVEIASQPSSSSLSSIGDEIITTGLRVGPSSYPPRRRRFHQRQQIPASQLSNQPIGQGDPSSQEEYDESESEEDRVMTSSNEHLRSVASFNRQQTAFRSSAQSESGEEDEDEDDDDENATALGRPSNSPTFRPQPNAFSHPPSHHGHRHRASTSTSHQSPFSRPSMPSRPQPRAQRHFMSPSYQADNDAALRASLTTLLSCAAAARGLPKKDNDLTGPSGTGGIGVGVMPSAQPMELRLVPESELMAQHPPSGSPIPPHLRQPSRTASNSSSHSPPSSNASKSRDVAATADKGKRHSAPQAKSPRAAKKKRTAASSDADATTTFISPTVLTWVVSAGVLVLVSVVGFGAGYVIGREVGRQEGALGVGMGSTDGAAAAANASSCGRELARSTSGGTLRRFKWGTVARGVTA